MKFDSKVYIYLIEDEVGLPDDKLGSLISALPEELSKKASAASSLSVKKERALAYSALTCALFDFGLNPHECKLEFTEYGKPYIKSGKLEFSISHSGGCAAIAIHKSDIKLGIDIQAESPQNEKLLPRLLSRFAKDFTPKPHSLQDFTRDTPEGFIEFIRLSVKSSNGYPTVEKSDGKITLGAPKANTEAWASCEALLKMDGRGFTASSELSAISESARLFTASVSTSTALTLALALAINKI